MPRVCSICSHPQRAAIDRALVAGESFRDIAGRYTVSKSSLERHRKEHLPARLVEAKGVQETADAIEVMDELRRCFDRVNRLFDACDRWLQDADDPSRYDIGPRAVELQVTYEDVRERSDGRLYAVRRKAPLSDLLPRIESDTRSVVLVETKYADPRELILKTAKQLQGQMELLSKLMGDLDERSTVNVIVSPQWLEVRTAILEALQPHAAARQAVATRLQVIEGGMSRARA